MKKLIFILSLCILTIESFSQNSNQWRGPNRDGIYKESGLLKSWPAEGPKLLWHYDQLGDGHSSASVTENRIYTAGMKESTGYIFCFDLEGKLLWEVAYGPEWSENWDGVRSTPVINEGKVYLMSSFGLLVCLDAANGKNIWSVDLMKEYGALNIQWGLTENLLIDGEKLFCTPGGTDANLLALNKTTGKLIWKCSGNKEKSAYGSPVIINVGGLKILVAMTEKSILGINTTDGTLLWSSEQTNQWSVHPNTPVYENGMLYCLSGYGKGGVMLQVAPDGKSVKELWRNSTLDSRMGGAIMKDGKIYGSGDKTRKLQCLDQKTGTLLYSEANYAPANLISAEGLLYVYAESGNVSLIQPQADAFKAVGSFKVPFGSNQHWAHLVISNKRLYVRHGNSLMVYDISAN